MLVQRLVLPPFFALSNPEGYAREELIKLYETKSQIFIVVESSLDMVIHLLRQAKKLGLVGRESTWIIPDSITSLLDSVNNSVISTMEGTLGVKTHCSTEDSSEYLEFHAQFNKIFKTQYPVEDNSDTSSYALRAYDSIRIVIQAIERMKSNFSSPKILLDNMLSSNFSGLSDNMLSRMTSNTPIMRIVNVVEKRYKEMDFWERDFGFSISPLIEKNGNAIANDATNTLPRKLQQCEKDWKLLPKKIH